MKSKRLIVKKLNIMIFSFVVFACCFVHADYVLADEDSPIMLVESFSADKACGPRCIAALLRLSGADDSECSLMPMYSKINKEPLSPTSLLELKKLAQEYGFIAAGTKLDIDGLRRLEGYAIVAVGDGPGTLEEPLHFVLVSGVSDNYVIVVDSKTLQGKAYTIQKFRSKWNGQALIISSSSRRMLRKGVARQYTIMDDGNHQSPKVNIDEEVKDFGEVDRGTHLVHTFIVSDAGEVLNYIVKKSCDCLRADIKRDINGRIILVLQTDAADMGNNAAYANVIDKVTGNVKRYKLKAYSKNTYEMYPSMVNINIDNSTSTSVPVMIRYYAGENDIVDFKNIMSNYDVISYELVDSGQHYTAYGANIWEFKYVLEFEADNISLNSKNEFKEKLKFVFKTGLNEHRLELPVWIKVGRPQYRFVPQLLVLSASEGYSDSYVRAKLELRRDSIYQDLKVKSVPTWLEHEMEKKEWGYLFKFRISKNGFESMTAGKHEAVLRLVSGTDMELKEIRIPISAFIHKSVKSQ